jgi:hypothetical protein
VADVRSQSAVTHALNDLIQLGAIGFDDEVNRQAVGGTRLGWADDGDQRAAGSNQGRGSLADVAADDIEYQIDLAGVFEDVVLESTNSFAPKSSTV